MSGLDRRRSAAERLSLMGLSPSERFELERRGSLAGRSPLDTAAFRDAAGNRGSRSPPRGVLSPTALFKDEHELIRRHSAHEKRMRKRDGNAGRSGGESPISVDADFEKHLEREARRRAIQRRESELAHVAKSNRPSSQSPRPRRSGRWTDRGSQFEFGQEVPLDSSRDSARGRSLSSDSPRRRRRASSSSPRYRSRRGNRVRASSRSSSSSRNTYTASTGPRPRPEMPSLEYRGSSVSGQSDTEISSPPRRKGGRGDRRRGRRGNPNSTSPSPPLRRQEKRVKINETPIKSHAPTSTSKAAPPSGSAKSSTAHKLPEGFTLPSADEIRRRHTSTSSLALSNRDARVPQVEMAQVRASGGGRERSRRPPSRSSPPSDHAADGGFPRRDRMREEMEADKSDMSADQSRERRRSRRGSSSEGGLDRRPSSVKPLAYLRRHGSAGGGASSMAERIERRASIGAGPSGEPDDAGGPDSNPFDTRGRRREAMSPLDVSGGSKKSLRSSPSDTESQVDEYQRVFNLFDRDGDGTLTVDELRDVFRTLGQDIKDKELKKMVAEIDENGDGEIDFDEFMTLMRGKNKNALGSTSAGLMSKLRLGFKNAAAKKLAEAVEAANLAKNPIEGMENFRGVEGREAVDYALRTRQQHLISHYHMADNKANMLITVGAIALSYSVSQIIDRKASYTLMNFSFWALIALLFAVYSVLPKYSSKAKVSSENSRVKNFNILFYEDFAQIPYETFMENMVELLDDDEILYAALSRDIYLMGTHLHQQKYKFLRWSYLTFALGILLSAVIFIVTKATGFELSQSSSVQGQ